MLHWNCYCITNEKKRDETMNTWRTNIPVVALVLLSAGALSGCETFSNYLTPEQSKPLAHSIWEEYCIAPNVVSAYGSSKLQAAAKYLKDLTDTYVRREVRSEEEKAKSLFCTQNLAGVVLVTDRVMNQALGKMEAGVQLAVEALDLNVANQQDTLARIVRIKNLSLGQKLDPNYAEELSLLEQNMGALATAVEEKLEKLAESRGITPAAQAKLEKAHGHLVDLRHYQGKAIAGFVIFDAARRKTDDGMRLLYQAFVEAIRLDGLGTTEELVTAFVEALPKFTETTIAGAKLSSAIWDAADTSDFEGALKAANKPSPAATDDMAEYAVNVKDSTSSLDLPGVEGLLGTD